MSADLGIISKPVREIADPFLDLVEKTYTASFPEEERRDFSLVRRLLEEDNRFEMYALLRDGIYVGFITGWQFEDFVYVEHFAIEESVRDSGIGAKAMTGFLALRKDPVVLEVEMPTEEMSKRRIRFYERLGFVLDHHVYFQPPYREGEAFLEMRLMMYGELDLGQSFERIKTAIHQNVYKVT
ncbi:GNAT family N-acetyltransferase [Parabacteroides sp. ZJ-118]|uniref:GNAT family N-acetyltransferase n=1 Tax=Parabacteroides sp. ZJ-118 TaxID=2709398 RepID=UPI0013EA0AEA|nr:GNAT family N-acetyltransferase [Parabacteroides sp. ZJ-118]